MLTDTEIRNKAKPRAKAFKLADHGGLYLLDKSIGFPAVAISSISWRQGEAPRACSYPEVSLKQAREKRDAIKRDGVKDKTSTFEAVARRAIAELAENRCDRHESGQSPAHDRNVQRHRFNAP